MSDLQPTGPGPFRRPAITIACATLATGNNQPQTMTITESVLSTVTWATASAVSNITADATDGTVTAEHAGFYLATTSILIKSTGTGKEFVGGIFLNGTEVAYMSEGWGLSGTAQAHFSASTVLDLDVGDVVTMQVSTTDAASTLVVTDGQLSVYGTV